MRNILTGWVFFLGISASISQKLEHFDLLLFALHKQSDSSWAVTDPRFLTAFNPRGYNNQPQFFTAHDLYLSVQEPGDTTQTDIVALNLPLRTTTRVTATPTPEYSPTPMPGGRRFSAVRVEKDGAQRLWSFPLDRSDNGRVIFPDIANVGYHCWLNDTLAALFLAGEGGNPHALAIVGTGRKAPLRIAFSVGRGLVRLPDGRLAFVQKATEQTWFIKAYDPLKKTSDILLKALPGSEDFAVLPDGTFLSGSGSKLYQFNPRRQTEWKAVADLSRYGVRNITRLALSPEGKIAIVVQ